MTCRRSDIVDVAHSGVYHCISRCVRRESLLSLPRRRAWLLSRLGVLTHAAAIDVIAFSAMENHLHLLLRTHPEVVARWSDREVALRKSLLLGSKTKNRKKKAKSKSEVLVETPVDTPREAAARLEMQISMIPPSVCAELEQISRAWASSTNSLRNHVRACGTARTKSSVVFGDRDSSLQRCSISARSKPLRGTSSSTKCTRVLQDHCNRADGPPAPCNGAACAKRFCTRAKQPSTRI